MEKYRKKKIYRVFKDYGFNITIDTNLHIIEYLDVTFSLKTGKCYPYKKRNVSLEYIHKQSSHPTSIIKRIPSMISKRLYDISSDKTFSQSCTIYNEALKSNSFNETLTFLSAITKRRHRVRKIILFNPPISSNVKTNLGKLFLIFLQKHFP